MVWHTGKLAVMMDGLPSIRFNAVQGSLKGVRAVLQPGYCSVASKRLTGVARLCFAKKNMPNPQSGA